MVYMVPLCTSPVPVRKIHFSQDSQIHEVQVRKSYFVPPEPIECLENLHMARTDLELGKCVPNFSYVSWSVFYRQMQLWEGRKSFANFWHHVDSREKGIWKIPDTL